MIAKIRKLNLAALSYDRDGILNVLQKTNAVEIKEHAETEGTSPISEDAEGLSSYLASMETALDILISSAENALRADKNATPPLKDGFEVTYEEFASAGKLREEMENLVERINSLTDRKNTAITEQTKLARAIAVAEPYAAASLPFNRYSDTLHTKTRLGVLPQTMWESLKQSLDSVPLCAYSGEQVNDGVLVCVTAHKSVFAEVEGLLTGSGFSLCPYNSESTGAEQLALLRARFEAAKEEQRLAEDALNKLTPSIRSLKIYCDYIDFNIEKISAASKMRGMERTFFLEAFVPADFEQSVKEALDSSGYAMWYAFSDPAEDEEVPTLLKNNAVVSNFEAITNMYSPPNAHEFDPNTVMAFFYSLFLGFIMGDIGYGILMFIGGGVLWYKSRKGSGIKSLSGVFAVGGVFAVFWGFLFNSFFGVQILPVTVMPDAQTGMYSFMGIKIPAVLVIAMILGISQLLTGYVCRAVQEWRKGNIIDGIFDGLVWALFSVGVALAILGLVEDFKLPQTFVLVGGITAGASLAIAALTAGRKEKLIGKFTKGFGSVYGVINYVSDILSYARLYGLMLSGAIIAQIVSKYSIQFITGGNVIFAIVGVLLMIVGHAFNLAIGLLGAYIHDARLQYVEFYGRFYTGEGELFAPLGSKHKHIYIGE